MNPPRALIWAHMRVWEHIRTHMRVWEHIQAHIRALIQASEHIQVWENIRAVACELFCLGSLPQNDGQWGLFILFLHIYRKVHL